jgi:hypothetical protein
VAGIGEEKDSSSLVVGWDALILAIKISGKDHRRENLHDD